tara:strand:+ start:478 stop:831 length:354 start_codon:yes stop_codon:yes gene_type:complete
MLFDVMSTTYTTSRDNVVPRQHHNTQEEGMTMYWVNVYEIIADEADYCAVAEFQGSQGLFDNAFDAARFVNTIPGGSAQGLPTRLGDQCVFVKVEHKRGSTHMIALPYQPHAQEKAA